VTGTTPPIRTCPDQACNGCHQATNFGFNVVTTPTGNAFLNQEFAPLAAGR